MADLKRTMDCGCIIALDYDRRLILIYCAKHEASPDLYEACKLVASFFERGNPQSITGFQMKGAVTTALAKAESKS